MANHVVRWIPRGGKKINVTTMMWPVHESILCAIILTQLLFLLVALLLLCSGVNLNLELIT